MQFFFTSVIRYNTFILIFIFSNSDHPMMNAKNQPDIENIRILLNTNFHKKNFLIWPPSPQKKNTHTMTERRQQKFPILVTLESLIWLSLTLRQHQAHYAKFDYSKNETNLTNLKYVSWHFSIRYVWPHLRITFLNLISKIKYGRNFDHVQEKMEFQFLPEKCHLWNYQSIWDQWPSG